jgi:DNA polymerase (family 10)
VTFSNQQVAQVFHDIATAMEVLGEHPFKTQAYSRAADTIANLPTSVYQHVENGTLADLPGVGPAISAKITELLTTGTMIYRERLREQVPDGVLDMVRVPGVGPKTALRIYHELGISSVHGLEDAARNGRLRTLKGIGAKAEARIGQALEARREGAERMLLGEALPLARSLIAALRTASGTVADLSYAGSVRRAVPTVGDIDLVAASVDFEAVINAFVALPQVVEMQTRVEQRVDVLLQNGKRCSLFVAPPNMWGTALALWTASAAHRARLQTIAHEHGFTLPDTSAQHTRDLPPAATEEAFYALLRLPFIPPELREDWGEIEAAQAGRLPNLIELGDIRADLHTHSTWSDGHNSIAEMAHVARARGYTRYAITDHSLYMGMVNGLDGARLREQRREIDAFNAEMARQGEEFRLLQGIEVDILPDGALALPDDVLAQLDWVVASPHVSLHQPRAAATERILRAIHHPHVDCIGHPTGRMLLRRQGSDLDMTRILDAAAETGTVLEVDGAYPRLDLDAEHVKRAVSMGIKIAIDSDAHGIGDLPNIEYGVLTARRGWAEANDVVNYQLASINEQ